MKKKIIFLHDLKLYIYFVITYKFPLMITQLLHIFTVIKNYNAYVYLCLHSITL